MSAGRTTRRSLLLAPLVVVTTSGCFATRSDVRVLQGDILSFRTEAARADSARARQIATVATSLSVVADSLRETSVRLARVQGDTKGDLRAIQQQLLQIQELTGQSQRRLQDLRAEMEARNQAPVVPPPVASTVPTPGTAADSARAAAAPAPPGPNQLYQLAYDQLRRASYSSARMGFEELLRLYPTSDLAPDAQFYIAESYAAEGTVAAGDSAYTQVALKYPRAPKAATALYKLGLSLARQGRKADARVVMDRVVKEHPNSDDAELARDWLRSNR